MKQYVLGLDLGTSSVGAVAIQLKSFDNPSDDNAIPVSIIDHHVYLFKEPVVNEQGTLVSKKKSRRESRQASKQRDRRQGRLKDLGVLCDKYLNNAEQILIFHDDAFVPALKQFQTLALRARAATHPVQLKDLAAIIIHLSKGRGV
ncbi:CRISPR-associated endonuclease Cas9 [Ephemeroptericola cinctiostellae]|uniref:CRISPR-associated endonuclease Cas9 n=1 Tax=Ephemeroptericola cinctiostellae TaxID=2268024 RepID=A0A345DB19_9BURK|nr:hypothetical protein [Ephemeroptericola cinctiostellae]AXF85557.1 CRISPR-associated endonuclease Cas9 [Ephemeroptericola cinctiostellae]